MTIDQSFAIARETIARISEERGWGADEAGIRSGKQDYRVDIAARAIRDAFSVVSLLGVMSKVEAE